MSESRKMGFMWGFMAGVTLALSVSINPIFILFTALAITANILFSRKGIAP